MALARQADGDRREAGIDAADQQHTSHPKRRSALSPARRCDRRRQGVVASRSRNHSPANGTRGVQVFHRHELTPIVWFRLWSWRGVLGSSGKPLGSPMTGTGLVRENRRRVYNLPPLAEKPWPTLLCDQRHVVRRWVSQAVPVSLGRPLDILKASIGHCVLPGLVDPPSVVRPGTTVTPCV